MLELLAKNAETTDFVADYPEKKDEAPAESIGEVKEGEIPLLIQWMNGGVYSLWRWNHSEQWMWSDSACYGSCRTHRR